MRLAVIASRIARRRELSRSLLDAEFVTRLAADHDVALLVDHAGPTTDELRRSGVKVSISEKRRTFQSDGQRTFADVAQANWLAEEHVRDRFDLLVQSSDRCVHPGVHNPVLVDVPRLVSLADGPTGYAGARAARSSVDHRQVRLLWSAAGWMCAADAVLSDGPVASYGMDDAGLPPRLATREVPKTCSDLPAGAELVVVVASAAAGWQLTRVLDLLGERVEADATVVILLGTTDREQEAEAGYVSTGLPASLADRVLFVKTGADEVAAEFLERADAVVCAEPSDLAVPLVADVAARTPTMVLGPPSSFEPARLWYDEPPKRSTTETSTAVLVSTSELASDAAGVLRSLRERGVEMLVLHSRRGVEVAQSLRNTPDLGRIDVAVGCSFKPPFGDPNVMRPHLGALAVHRRLWPSLLEVWEEERGLRNCVLRALSPRNLDVLRVLHVPVALPEAPARLDDRVLPGWKGDWGVLPRVTVTVRPRRDRVAQASSQPAPTPQAEDGALSAAQLEDEFRHWVKTHGWSDRARLALPWRAPQLQALIRSHELPSGVLRWVKDHTWTERLPLLLPWRFGLLGRKLDALW